MTASSFDICLGFVLSAEGGFVDDPFDPGGATNLGITLDTLSEWRRTAVTKADVQNLSRDEATAIYRSRYWNAVRGDDLPIGVDLMVFDAGVNLGTARSVTILQRLVMVDQDGAIGPLTLAATEGADAGILIGELGDRRRDFYRSLPSFARYGNGWLARVDSAERQALALRRA